MVVFLPASCLKTTFSAYIGCEMNRITPKSKKWGHWHIQLGLFCSLSSVCYILYWGNFVIAYYVVLIAECDRFNGKKICFMLTNFAKLDCLQLFKFQQVMLGFPCSASPHTALYTAVFHSVSMCVIFILVCLSVLGCTFLCI